jgi:hypothetical protein
MAGYAIDYSRIGSCDAQQNAVSESVRFPASAYLSMARPFQPSCRSTTSLTASGCAYATNSTASVSCSSVLLSPGADTAAAGAATSSRRIT